MIRVMRGDRWRVPREAAANSCCRKGSPLILILLCFYLSPMWSSDVPKNTVDESGTNNVQNLTTIRILFSEET